MDRAAFEEQLSLMSKDMHEQLTSHLKRGSAEELSDQKPDFETVSITEAHLTIKGVLGASNAPKHSWTKDNSKQTLVLRWRSLRARQEDVFLIKQSMRHTQRCLMSENRETTGSLLPKQRNHGHRKIRNITFGEIGKFCTS